MKIFLPLIGMMLLMTGLTWGQPGLGLNAYAGGGLNVPLDDVANSWKLGGHGSVAAGYPLTPGLEGAGRYSYYSFPLDDNPDSAGFADTDEKLVIHEFAAEVRAQLTPPGINIKPYGIVGFGAAKTPRRTEFFYCAGGGLKFPAAPKVNFFIEARYCWVSAEDFSVNYIPITAGINLSL